MSCARGLGRRPWGDALKSPSRTPPRARALAHTHAHAQTQIPIYDFKQSRRSGYQAMELPASRIVIIEGIYALSERLRPLLDLKGSITGAYVMALCVCVCVGWVGGWVEDGESLG